MNNPLVSIIIPVYNAESTLKRCVNSILSQTFINFKLFLIDDCSKDNSSIICDDYAKKDGRVISIHNKENCGVTITRNKGLDCAVGEYILFIDDDDYVDSSYIETFIDATEKHPDTELLTQNIVFHIEGKSTFVETNQLSLGGPWGKLFKRAIIETSKIRFIPHLEYNEDNLFCLDYLEKITHVDNISVAGYHYIIHEKCTSKKLENNYLATSKGLKIILKRLEQNVFKNEYNQTFAQNRCSFIFYRYINALYSNPNTSKIDRKKNFVDVMESANCSIKYYPKHYKMDYIIVALLFMHFYTLAFFLNNIIFKIRISITK